MNDERHAGQGDKGQQQPPSAKRSESGESRGSRRHRRRRRRRPSTTTDGSETPRTTPQRGDNQTAESAGSVGDSGRPSRSTRRRRRRRRPDGRRSQNGTSTDAIEAARTAGETARSPADAQRPSGQLSAAMSFPEESDWEVDEATQQATTQTESSSICLGEEESDWREGVRPSDLTEATPPDRVRCIAHVRLGLRAGKVHVCDTGDRRFKRNAWVVVETDRGLAVGQVVTPTVRQPADGDLPRVLRVIDENDQRQRTRNEERQREALRLCQARINERGLPMKLLKAEYLHSGNKATFFFTAENRVDFRELVRDLAKRLHTRIEMRQVGVRDAAGLAGGLGPCGQQLCCSRFLQRFDPVSIRMAKDQGLVLNPNKVSGQCGRLKCCLAYEQQMYREARKGLPDVGKRVITPHGRGVVRELDILRRIVRVQGEDGSVTAYPASEVRRPKPTAERKSSTTQKALNNSGG